ncbi:MAG TPA: anthranilate synthase component I family protein [Puia sp.]|nr:anthranilate synthase component I family protein [Puia sp.]
MPSARKWVSYTAEDLHETKQQVLSWAARFHTCCVLDNQQYQSPQHRFEFIAAAGALDQIDAASGNAFNLLSGFSGKHRDWLFGHFSFTLKSETEGLASRLPDHIGFPDLFFFIPQIIIQLGPDGLLIGSFQDDHDQVLAAIRDEPVDRIAQAASGAISVSARIDRDHYLKIIRDLKAHILRGDCYEINFCQEFFSEGAVVEPVALFRSLNRLSPSPFSAFYRVGERYLLCASPERYLQKKGNRILSQPIKGTMPRAHADGHEDDQLRQALYRSEKDRVENVMVVDLVRNDLSKICEPDTVRVDELFGIYSFPQVHQMISSVSGQLKPGPDWPQLIAKTFPMGSMTGAPKRRVLELIEQYETSARGLFSGAVGYVNPETDFDFNVVIRSLQYNRSSQYLSYFAGSGITISSDPEKEYEECLMKVTAMETALKNPGG